jgi:hypothetical protein
VDDDQLPAALEEVEQRRLALGPLEHVGPVDLDHRQHAALDVQRVARAGQLLLLGQQRLAGDQPLVACDDLGQRHAESPFAVLPP